MGGLATVAQIPMASAGTKPMNIDASGGDNTKVVQPNITDSVQGVKDSDGDQDAFDLINSEDVTPQFKAENKMTK
jgi:hypothetical protein